MSYAEIAVDAPVGAAKVFSYSVPDGMELLPGQTVRVPFGPRTLQGIVLELTDHPQVEETRPVSALETPEPLLGTHQLALARWIGSYYICPLFDAAAPMLPPGARQRERVLLSMSDSYTATAPNADADSSAGPASTAGDSAADDAIETIANSPGQLKVLRSVRRHGSIELEWLVSQYGEEVRSSAMSLARRGVLNRKTRSPAFISGPGPAFAEYFRARADAFDEITRWLCEHGKRAPRQSELIMRLAESGLRVSAVDARREFGGSVVSALLKKGFMSVEREPLDRGPLAGREFPSFAHVTLSDGQRAAVADVVASVRDTRRHPRTILVRGVTGSGKTEIYLSAVEECLALGKQAVVMVPEISLTPQTIERFASRFPSQVAVLHSRMTPAQRRDQWWAVKTGLCPVVIGSRSAVFAPVSSLGLIVLDEEHEWTYKQNDAAPRYHARDVAIELGRISGAVTLLGSASPDVGSHYRASREIYGLHVLPERLTRMDEGGGTVAPLPDVEIVDMRRELREGNAGMFSRSLASELASCLNAGRQAILFLNRRGAASQVQCRHCGYSVKCQGCDVPLTYHRPLRRLVCHYCGRRRRVPKSCPQCLSFRLGFYGIGTQTVADTVASQFPNARALRWDSDTARNLSAYEDILNSFRNGEADILIGTQMLSKGLHLPSVTFVGVVLADVGLSIPDFRAGERTFQLLCQVAGRAGRGREPGKVVFQTYQPENYAIQAAAEQDYMRFYDVEMRHRREHGNPPHSRLIRLVTRHTNMATAETQAQNLAEALRTAQLESDLTGIEVIGPTPPYPPRLRGRFRWHIVIRGRNPRALIDLVSIPKDWSVDVDPVALT